MKKIKIYFIMVCLVALILPAHLFAFSGEVFLGSGSYSNNVIPPGATNVQSTMYKTSNVTSKMPTNDWWSNLAWDQYSEAQYPHPLAIKNQSTGTRIYYPGNRMTTNTACICGFINDIHDFTVGHSAVATFPDAKVDGFNDWFVKALYQNGSNSMNVTYGHGSPYVYFTFAGGNPKVSFYTPPTIWSGSGSTPVLGITMEGAHYGLYGATGSTWTGIGGNTLTNNGSTYFSIAALPDNSVATLNKFAQYAYSHVTNTQVDYSYNTSTSEVTSTFNYTTQAKQGSQTGTIFALYPHQWKNSTTPLLSYTYNSVRGQMKTGEGTSFQTKMKFTGILPSLPDKGTYNRTTLQQYLDEAELETWTGANDTYWIGKRLGKLATLAPIADQLGDTTAANTFRNEIKNRLQDWLKASDSSGNLKSTSIMYYNNTWGTLIGYPASYGSSEELNDHHFHYGYFIKAAAEIARVDKAWATSWGPMINLLIRDIASSDRNDTMFPYLRNFDPYAGHSWASGHARFGDGNNNESSSEGMNAWAGMILWGEATGNTAIRDTGIELYTTEMNAINEYWFDVTGTNHGSFSRSTASMLWGGKVVGDGTWWTANPEEVHGINWLPITGASLYLTHYPTYTGYNYDTLVTENGGTSFSPWEDLIYMYRAISNVGDAKAKWASRGAALTPEQGSSRAQAYHWIYNLDGMGNADRTVTANTPLYSVFNKGGVKTYIAYNSTNTAKTVTFSDGQVVSVPANSFNTGNGDGGGGGDNPILADGYYKIIARHSGKAAVVQNASTANGANVLQYTYENSTTNDEWQLVSIGGGYYKILNRHSGKALVVEGASTSNGGNVNQYTYEGATPNDEWKIESTDSGYYKIINRHSGLVLDVSDVSTANNANIHQWGYVGGNNQQWGITEVTTAPPNTTTFTHTDYTIEITKPSSSSAQFKFTPNSASNFVDIHYKVNNGGQQNLALTNSNGSWGYTVTGLTAGAVVDFFYTYTKNGLAYDSSWYQYIF